MLLDAVENHERTFGKKIGRTFKSTVYHLKNVLLSLHHGISWSSAYKTARGVLSNNLEDMREVSSIVDTEKVTKKATEKTNQEQVREQTLTELLQPDQLQSIYLNIPQWIEKITLFEDVNFVFLIDDLDRCLPENTLKMLESIKLFLDVPSCAFVLAVDDDVVERGVVHHYRDYLSIYHSQETEGAKGVLQHELPITGHEYLEKMIQLPIRLPVIDTVNVREFLEECSAGWIALIDKKYNPEGQENEFLRSKLLDFFAKSIPPKPRKIKRVALLFESKLKLLGDMSYDVELVAKVTLLELFAPKLLRFIQNNGYTTIYNRLCHFREVEHLLSQKNQEKENSDIILNDLADTQTIEKYIKRTKKEDPSAYTQKEQDLLLKVMGIVQEHYSSRITFDLDYVFTEKIDASKLKLVIELQEEQFKKTERLKVSRTTLSEEMLQKLFRPGDVDAWREALVEYDAQIELEKLNELIEQAKEKRDNTFNDLPFIANPEWVGEVAKYVNDDDYIKLLVASHDVRFKTIKDKTQIDSFQLTFAEYDKYYDLVGNVKKPQDEGWGRGRRPVINVSWHDAVKYIAWLNELLIGVATYALPTEDEWYLACNKGKDSTWHFGDDVSQLKEYAWSSENSENKTHPVGEKKPNALELYDMHGNVWEWCENWYDEDKDRKVLRGGSWYIYANYSVSTVRIRSFPTYSDYYIGFRLQRTLDS